MNPPDEPESWHCHSCGHQPTTQVSGLTRRQLLLAAGVTTAAAATWRGRPSAAGVTDVQPLTSTAAAGDALARGVWLAGDTHVHTDHSSDGSATRQGSNQVLPGNVAVSDQIGQAERMGLQFLPITDHRTYDQHWDPQWTSSKLLLVPGEEANGAPHATCLGAVDVIVDGANPPGSAPHRHVQQSFWDARA
ncbi:MAG: hypothetical protein JWN31_96, partial [Frankiales bacterium]|nr:hypothetical protein [Frankiales bacterium]